MNPAAPVSASARLETLDVLRGFALLGILAMNIRAMAAPFSAYMNPYDAVRIHGPEPRCLYLHERRLRPEDDGPLLDALRRGRVAVRGQADRVGQAATRTLVQADVLAAAFGLVHAYLIWDGDILVPYALCGIMLLWWVRRLPAWALMAGAVALSCRRCRIVVGHGIAWDSMGEAERARHELEVMMPTPEQSREQLANLLRSYPEVVAHRAPFVFGAQTFFFLCSFSGAVAE